MDKLEKFLDFIRENPPPCFHGETMYCFNSETGEIVHPTELTVSRLAIDGDGNWFVEYEDEEDDFKSIDKNELNCSTYENAKKFRDKVGSIKYGIFIPSDNGGFVGDDEQTYEFLKVKKLLVKNMKADDSYIKAILRRNSEIKPGMVIMLAPTKSHLTTFRVLKNKKYDEFYDIEANTETELMIVKNISS